MSITLDRHSANPYTIVNLVETGVEKMRWIGKAVLTAILLAILASPAAAGPVSNKLTSAELARVKAGEVIIHETLTKNHEDGYAAAFGIIHFQDPQAFWDVAGDFGHFPEFIPKIEKATLIKQVGKQSLVEFYLDGTIETLIYSCVHTISEDNLRVDWTLDKSRPHVRYKVNDGYWQLEQLAPGLWLTEYNMTVSFDFGILTKAANKIVNTMVKEDLPNVMGNTRKRIESGGVWKKSN